VLRALLLLTVWGLLAIPVGIIALPWTVLTQNAELLYRWGATIGAIGLRVAGVKARVRYVAPLPVDTPCLFLVNHASNIDPPLLAGVLLPRRTAMLIKRELLRIPLLGWGMRLAGFVAVARSGSVDDAKRSLVKASAVLRSGVSLAVFVEGTRSSRKGRSFWRWTRAYR
jgi:1-acyl-sn-glycerol-3-phosphate acyltransferase